MEIKVTIKELTHEDLVNLLSTTFYGSPTFAPMLVDEFMSYEYIGEGDCLEDKMANVLLCGGRVAAIDLECDDELFENKGVLARINEGGEGEYQFDLKAIKKGLKMALESKKGYIRSAALNFLIDDGSFDAGDAEVLIQMIIFGEVIYG